MDWEQKARTRNFELWGFTWVKARACIRSHKGPFGGPNADHQLDFIAHNTRYIAVPRYLKGGIEITAANPAELGELGRLLGEPVPGEQVRIVVCQGRRFPIVAFSFATGENDFDFSDDPFERIDAYRGSVEGRPYKGHELRP